MRRETYLRAFTGSHAVRDVLQATAPNTIDQKRNSIEVAIIITGKALEHVDFFIGAVEIYHKGFLYQHASVSPCNHPEGFLPEKLRSCPEKHLHNYVSAYTLR